MEHKGFKGSGEAVLGEVQCINFLLQHSKLPEI